MKRWMALLLALSMLLSMVGCSTEDLEEAAKDYAKEAAAEAVGGLKDAAKDKVDEIIDDAQDKVDGMVDDAKESADAIFSQDEAGEENEDFEVPRTGDDSEEYSDCYNDHSKPRKYDEEQNIIVCDCGHEYKQPVDYETFKSMVVTQHTIWTRIFRGISEFEYYSEKYSAYRGVCVCELGFDESEYFEIYVLKQETYELQCADCESPYPLDNLDSLKFSVFLELYYPKKNLEGLTKEEKLEKLKEKQKLKAVDAYIQVKALMTANRIFGSATYTDYLPKKETIDPFEFYGMLAGTPEKIQKAIPLLNSEAFYLAQNYLPSAFSDAGVKSAYLDVVGDMTAVLDFVEVCGVAQTAIKEKKQYHAEKAKGIENYYYTRNAYVDFAIANANTLAAFASFLGNFGISVGAPSPDIDSILKDIKKIARTTDLQTNYRMLSAEESLINDDRCVNDVLWDLGITQFAKIMDGHNSAEAIEEAMKQGPAAQAIAEAIPHIIAETDSTQAEATAKALWYYYGWRLEHDYDVFLASIYNDEI